MILKLGSCIAKIPAAGMNSAQTGCFLPGLGNRAAGLQQSLFIFLKQQFLRYWSTGSVFPAHVGCVVLGAPPALWASGQVFER